MSPKRLQLEGNSVAEVMERVAATFGSVAHVVDAKKVRTKGLGGFFAREYYLVTVEVPAELAHQDTGRSQANTTATAPDRTNQGYRRQAAEAPKGVALSGLDAMLAAADGGDGFEYSSVLPAPLQPMRLQPAQTEPAQTEPAQTEPAQTEPAQTEPAQTETSAAAGPASLTDSQREFSEVLRNAQAVANNVAREFEATTFARIERPVPFQVTPQPTSHPAGVTLVELAALGIPKSVLSGLPTNQTTHTLSQVMSRVPAAPSLLMEDGNIMVVLGIGGSAREHAVRTAKAHGIPEASVVAAGPKSAETSGARLILTASSAREARKSAREQGDTLVAYLDVGDQQSDRYFAARLLQALDADFTVAVVRADHDMAHVSRCISEVIDGTTITALAVEGLVGTAAPGRVMSLGIPVSHIDHLPANVVVWAAAMSTALPTLLWD